jgi:hypothetical protein
MKYLATPASRHLALHATRLAVARWRLGASGMAAAAMPQANWHATVQQQFMDWLAAGGFNMEEQHANENSGTAAAVLMSRCGTGCEEFKFSRVRIRDAVE